MMENVYLACPHTSLDYIGTTMSKSVQILPPDESNLLRQAYLEAFVDTSSEHYQKYIAPLQQFSDGKHYTGYLWDNLRPGRKRITFERLSHEIVRHPEVNVMADNHSRDRVMGAPLWPYPTDSVIVLSPSLLIQLLQALPEDLYIFDSTFAWTLILTHEHDTKRRICIAAGDVVED